MQSDWNRFFGDDVLNTVIMAQRDVKEIFSNEHFEFQEWLKQSHIQRNTAGNNKIGFHYYINVSKKNIRKTIINKMCHPI